MTQAPDAALSRPAWRQALQHRRIMCGFTLAMMALSWPVWIADKTVPRFPVLAFESFGSRNPGLETLALVICLAGLMASLSSFRIGRIGSGMTALAGCILVLFDQNRLQAWFYQTIVLSLVYALLPAPAAIGFVRFFAVTLYAHSALSKLDWSFMHSMGPYLLSPLLDLLPIHLDDQRTAYLALALPIGELAFALALACGFWRAGQIGATIMHLALLASLGPWALDHSGNVLIWNVSMLIQAWIAFDPRTRHSDTDALEPPVHETSRPHETPDAAASLGFVQLVMITVAILPFFERTGLWDPWPSFALYAGHVEQLRIDWPAELENDIPANYRPFLSKVENDLVLDLTLWSRARLGVPPYPAGRIHRRLATWIAETCPADMPMRAIFLSKANWRTGVRQETVLSSAKAILAR